MTEAERLNRLLAAHAPAAYRCLSPIGRAAAFPRGIPFQSRQARDTRYNATIGQVTDGAGHPLPLPQLADRVPDLDPEMCFLYSPISGHRSLRLAWSARQHRIAGPVARPTSLPVVTHGLTQGVGMVATLFADSDTDVLLPAPYWENYDLLFTFQAEARVRPWSCFVDGRFDLTGLEEALAESDRKAVVVLNFPQNPTGYTPTVEEGRALVDLLVQQTRPMVVAFDDAYSGMVYEPGLIRRSLFWDLAERADPEQCFPVRLDGVTKELLFFPSRVGFLTYAGDAAVCEAMESKLEYVARATVGGPPGPSQAMVVHALGSPDLQATIDARLEVLATRYRALRLAIADLDPDRLRPYPFNSGCFAILRVLGHESVDDLRARLITEFDTGVIAIPEANAVRLAYCSTSAADLPELVARIGRALPD